MNKRTLKFPDGSTYDLAIPEGFGAPIFAMNDAEQSSSKVGLKIVGFVLAAATIFTLYKAFKSN